jgi:hypothetical protein
MSGDHNQYQKPEYVDRRQWKYDPMTGEPLVDGWPLYSGLPQREWRGLTDDEEFDLVTDFIYGHEAVQKGLLLASAVEAKLKEKNT